MKQRLRPLLRAIVSVRLPKAALLAIVTLAGAASVLVGVDRLLGLEAALILGGAAAVALGLLTDLD